MKRHHHIVCAIVLVLTLCVILFTARSEAVRNNVGYFWQVTDPHIDLLYVEGSDPDCDFPLCCRERSANQKHFAGRFGNFGNCDSPVIAMESALEFMRDFVPPGQSQPIVPDFVLYGGDTLPHDIWLYNPEYNLHYDRYIAELFTRFFPPEKVSVIPAIGNHEPSPVDQLDPVPPASDWFLSGHARIWERFIADAEAREMHEKKGYFSFSVRKGLRLVVLNTQWQDPLNFFLYRNGSDHDPAGQLKWLTETLTMSENLGEKVYILGHIPPGIADRKFTPESRNTFNVQYEAIVERFSRTIVFQTFGHTHKDSFRVFTDTKTHTQATGVAFITPALTSYGDQFPSVRLYEYDLNTYELLDMKTYFGNITEANIKGSITWRLEYSARDAYNMMDLKPASWLKLAHQLKTDPVQWNKFDMYYYVMYRKSVSCAFGSYCHKQNICAITCAETVHYAHCLES